MERKYKRMHPEDVGAGSSGGKRRKCAYYPAMTVMTAVGQLMKIK
jgi:hypothetical protein